MFFLGSARFTTVHHRSPPFATVHDLLFPLHPYNFKFKSFKLHISKPKYKKNKKCFTTVHHRSPPFTTVHHRSPPYTTVHHCSPPATPLPLTILSSNHSNNTFQSQNNKKQRKTCFLKVQHRSPPFTTVRNQLPSLPFPYSP